MIIWEKVCNLGFKVVEFDYFNHEAEHISKSIGEKE